MRSAFVFCLLALPAFAENPPDILVLGEVHDNADAHLAQAAALRALKPKAVIFEMLLPEEAEKADADRSRLAAAWEASNWSDYEIYKPVFAALGNARIIGAATPRDQTRSIAETGAAALFGTDAARFGLDAELPATQQARREKLQFEAHCEAVPMAAMPAMVAIQRYRDASFARAALKALDTYGAPVAIITGNGHARTDWGVPAMLAMAAPQVTTHSVGHVEEAGNAPFDEVHIIPRTERPDPCAVFLKN